MLHVTLAADLKPTHARRLISVGGSESTGGADGNYVLTEEALQATEVVVSFGINDDWSFEEEVHARTGAEVHAYDKSTRDRFLKRFSQRRARFYLRKLRSAVALLRCLLLPGRREAIPEIVGNLRRSYFPRQRFLSFFDGRKAFFHPEYIGPASAGMTPVARALGPHAGKRVLLKMDIEGGEYSVMDELLSLPDNVHVVLCEFHALHEPDKMARLLDFTRASPLKLVHIHANNIARPAGADGKPPVLELSYVSQRYFEASGEQPEYPISGLDTPNSAELEDYGLAFE